MDDRVRAQIGSWRDHLINLSRNNRLLYFKRTKTSTLRITQPDIRQVLGEITSKRGGLFWEPPDQPDPSGSDGDDIAAHARTPRAPGKLPRPSDLVTDTVSRSQLRRSLRSLERHSNQEFLDRGLWVLYLALGSLEWIEPPRETGPSQTVSSPLILFPVRLEHDGREGPYSLWRTDDDIAVNPALSYKLQQNFDLTLPDLEDDDADDVDQFFAQLDRMVRGREGWAVSRASWLSTFSFHKEVMFQDLKNNESQIAGHPVVRAMALGHRATEGLDFSEVPEDALDHHHPPEKVLTILDADSSQRQCLAAAAQGHSFIIEGPPGTGKSQTIANLIADALGRNQTVLFVSEKAAALEVVKARLDRAQLGEFVLELHSHKATRREVAHALGQSLFRRLNPRVQLGEHQLRQLAKQREELNAYATAVNELRRPLNMSVHEVLGRVAGLHDIPAAPSTARDLLNLSASDLTAVTESCQALAQAWGPVSRGDGFLWRVTDTRLTQTRRATLEGFIREQERAVKDLEQMVRELAEHSGLSWLGTLTDGLRFKRLLTLFDEPRSVPQHWLEPASLSAIRERIAERQLEVATLHRSLSELSGSFGPSWERLDSSDLGLVRDSKARLEKSKLGSLCDRIVGWRSALALADQMRRVNGALRSVAEFSSQISSTLGSAPPASLHQVRALRDLSRLAVALHKPEGALFDHVALAAADEAVAGLETAVTQQNQRLASLRQLFTDSILNADCHALALRFSEIHRGFGKLRPAYWRDRRILRQHSKSGRVRAQEIAGLTEVLTFQDGSIDLGKLETRHAGALGPRLYRSLETDFKATRGALETARVAIRLASGYVSADALSTHLSAESQSLTTLAELGQQLSAPLDELDGLVSSLGADASALFEGETPSELVALTEGFADALSAEAEPWKRIAVLASREEVTIDVVIQWLSLKQVIDVRHAALKSSGAEDHAAIGPRWQGDRTDFSALQSDLEWAEAVAGALDGSACGQQTLTELARGYLTRLSETLRTWSTAVKRLADEFIESERESLTSEFNGSFEAAAALLSELRRSIDDIVEWGAFVRARVALERLGCREQVDFCIAHEVTADSVVNIIVRSVLAGWLDEVCDSDARVRLFRSQDRDRLVEQFRELDRRFIELASGRVIETCNQRRPTTTGGAVALVASEANKQRRHMPTRTLMESAGPVIQALKPCFMMSPLTVSQFLPPSMAFDLVIFDEASQVRPSDAVNCIYRGRQLVIAGDQRQLPPTPFFDRLGTDLDDEWDEEQLEEYESVLDVAKGAGTLKAISLRWHYRSQHEDLITYSNYSFYEGRLVTFPCSAPAGPDLGVELFNVRGVYRRGGARDNPIEASAVVDRVLDHLGRRPDLTIGVVAFSEAQASTIEREIERRSTDHPELRVMLEGDRLSGGFVKNLETVQGDERDIIVFSIGYGPDEMGRVTMQFGPLTKAGGQRRLNVAITRARRRVDIVSSIRYVDFPSDIGSEGVRHLRRYLEFAERTENRMGALVGDLGDGNRDVESPFEEEVMRAVRSWGYQVTPQVGCAHYRIDLGVRHPTEERYILGIECDGAMYHSSRVARDRDRLRQEVLARLGWAQLHRIWGLSWYRNRGAEEQRLQEAIEKALRPTKARAPQLAPTEVAVDVDTIALSDIPDWVTEYRVAKLGRLRGSPEMHDGATQGDLQLLILKVVEAEGPVAKEVVLRRVRDCFGAERAGKRARLAFDAAVRSLRRRGLLVTHERDFLQEPDKDEFPVRRGRKDISDTMRAVDEVPPGELQNAILQLVRDVHPISEDELSTRVAAIFGWARRGPDIAETLKKTVRALVVKKLLRRTDSGLQPGN